LHFTAFHPDWKMPEVAATPPATLSRARRIAQDAGLHYVYTGNVHDRAGGTTCCPRCAHPAIIRDWYDIGHYDLTPAGACPNCGTAIAGRFGQFDHPFGPRRIPVRLHATT
jgi:pyruvate formate lyase activating enzyme